MREFSGDFDSSSLIGTMLSMSVHYPRAKTPRQVPIPVLVPKHIDSFI